ncbi:PREDICTED: uncharacterized protein LOC104611864 isoform X2 [Nelumbo nucifera]|uniref:Uncharacterized protein LOC104611864 isoform X2 n=1 Tax=Nelumbo nucifera TaxID=4432 RepID=A0A1U8B8J5_NELNU|nr:PREDICTED: uncharacterized protein LOC104611864 isoform X2 [Nelumbo nucifera]
MSIVTKKLQEKALPVQQCSCFPKEHTNPTTSSVREPMDSLLIVGEDLQEFGHYPNVAFHGALSHAYISFYLLTKGSLPLLYRYLD